QTLGGPTMAADVLLEKSARLARQVTPAVTPLRDGVRVGVHHSSATFRSPDSWRAHYGGRRVAREISAPCQAGDAGGDTAARWRTRVRASLQCDLPGAGNHNGRW